MKFDKGNIPGEVQQRLLETRLVVETGWTFEYVASLPLWRVGDYLGYKKAVSMIEDDNIAAARKS